jgi:hypothetical protein
MPVYLKVNCYCKPSDRIISIPVGADVLSRLTDIADRQIDIITVKYANFYIFTVVIWSI